MTRSVRKWYLIDNGDGTFDVTQRGRPVLVGAPRASAMRYIRKHKSPGEKLFSVAEDGYQTRM